MKKGLFTIVAVISFFASTYAQSDACASATPITPGATCTSTTGNVTGATQSLAPCAGSAAEDVWYTFTSTSSVYTVNVQGQGNFNAVFAVYSGSCASLLEHACINNTGNGSLETATIYGINPGDDIFIRVYESNGSSNNDNFSICVVDECPSGSPANDNCSSATALTASSPTSGTIECANPGSDDPADPADICASTIENTIWYSFTPATTEDFEITIDNISCSVGSGVQFGVFTGTCPGPYTSVATCASGAPSISTSLTATAGTTYYFVVDGNAGAQCDFDIEVTPTSPPAGCALNDDCGTDSETIALTSSTTSCVSGCNTGATSGGILLNTCSDLTNPTVWYEITIPAGDVLLNISVTSADFSTPEIYLDNSNCNDLTYTTCLDGSGGSAIINNQAVTPGNTYYIAVQDASGGDGDFDICLLTTPDLSPCNTDDEIVATPAPDASNLYYPGEVVEICYTINQFEKAACNYLHGIVPTFGDCWDPASFNASGMPVDITTALQTASGNLPMGAPCFSAPSGAWGWYADGVVTHNSSGNPVGAGWFFVTNSCYFGDGVDPNTSYGDGYHSSSPCNAAGNGYTWTVCFNLTVKDDGSCDPVQVCDVEFQTWADGQTGGWGSTGCDGDLPETFTANICCISLSAIADSTICIGDSVELTGMNEAGFPGTFTWYDGDPASGGSTVSSTNVKPTSNATYFVIYDEAGCKDTTSFSILVTPLAVANDINPSVCESSPGSGMATGVDLTSFNNQINSYGSTITWYTDQNLTAAVSTPTSEDVGNGDVYYAGVDSALCTNIAAITITVTSTFTATGSVSNVQCNNASDGQVTITPASGVSPFTYTWSTSANTNNTETGLAPGNYIVSISDAANCNNTVTFTITEPSALSISIASTSATCSNASDGNVNITVTGGTTDYTYLWSNNSTLEDISGLAIGNYTVSATDDNNCLITATESVSAPPALSISTAATSITCNSNSDGAINTTVSGGTGSYTFSWSNAATTQDISGLAPNTYTITVTDGACNITASENITEPSALSITSTSTSVTCNGNSDGTANITVSGGSGSYTFNWSNGATTEDISSLPASIYTVTVSDGACNITASETITEPSALSITSASTSITCNGGNDGAANITVSGGSGSYTFSWSNGATTEDISSLTANTYSVTVSNGACNITASETVSQPGPITISTTITDAACGVANGSIETNPISNGTSYTYSWNNSATTQNITGLNAGTFTVTVTSNLGCIRTRTDVVTNPSPTITVTVINDVSCNGGNDGAASVAATGGNTPYTYMWDNGITAASTNGLNAGVHYVTVTDNTPCVGIETFTITEPTSITASISTTEILCFGDSNGSADLSISGGTPPYTYSWSNGETTQDISGLPEGIYSVYAVDDNNCVVGGSQVSSACVEIHEILANACGADEEDNEMIRFQIGPSSINTTDISVDWPSAAWDGYCQTAATATTVANINGTITGGGQLIEPGATIPAFAQVIVVTSELFDWSAHDWTNLDYDLYILFQCGDQGVAHYKNYDFADNTPRTTTVNIGACSDVVSYVPDQLLNGGDGDGALFADDGTPTSTNNGCSAPIAAQVTPMMITITQPTALTLTEVANNDVLCNGESSGSAQVLASGGITNYTYAWSNGSNISTATGLSNNSYTVTVTDANNCTENTTVTIAEPTALVGSIACTSVTAIGGTDGAVLGTTSGGTTPYTYTWDVSGLTTNSVTGLSAGAVNATITDANGCSVTDMCTIIEPGCSVTLAVTTTDATCFGFSDGTALGVLSGGTTNYTFVWSSSVNTTNIETGLTPGVVYYVTATDANNCSASTSITLSEPTTFTASIVCTSVTTFGGSDGTVSATASGGTTGYVYTWDVSGLTTNSVTGLSAGAVNATITDANGCSVTDVCTITEPTCNVSISTSVSEPLCNGNNNGQIIAELVGGSTNYSFVWSSSVNTTNTETGLTTGTYYITATDDLNCAASTTITLSEPSAITASIACVGVSTVGGTDGSVTSTVLGGTTPYNYNWNISAATTSSVTGLSSGVVNATISDANGCNEIDICTITEPTCNLTLTVNTTPTLCFGSSDGQAMASTTGGTTNYTYTWSTSVNISDIETVLYAGNYNLTSTDAIGCTVSESFTISEPNAITVSTTTTFAPCNTSDGTATAIVSGGTTAYTYLWGTGAQTTQTATGLAAGTRSVTVTDGNSCVATANALVSNPAPLVTVTAITSITCNGGSEGATTITADGGVTPYTYTWGSPTQSNTTGTITGLIGGTHIISISDNLNCLAVTTVDVDEPQALTITSSVSDITCFGLSDGFINVTPTGGVGAYTFSWSTGATTQNISGLVADIYDLNISDDNGCSTGTTTSTTISTCIEIRSILVDACHPDSQLEGLDEMVFFETGSSSLDVNDLTVSWPTANLWRGVCTNPTWITNVNASITGGGSVSSPPGGIIPPNSEVLLVTNIKLTDTYNSLQNLSEDIYVIFQCFDAGSPNSNDGGHFGNYSSDGSSHNLTFDFGGGCLDQVSYIKNLLIKQDGSSGGENGATVNYLDDGTATYVNNGCVAPFSSITPTSGAFSFTITEPLDLTLTMTSNNISCNGFSDGNASTTVLGGTTPYTYLWDNGATTVNISGINSGTSTVTITDANSCTITDNVTITEPLAITATTSITNVLCNGESNGTALVSVSGGTTPYIYNWNDAASQTTATATGMVDGTYSVTITDNNLCINLETVTINEPDVLFATGFKSNATCFNGTDGSILVNASGGTTPYTYLWNNGFTTSSSTALSANQYIVTVFDANSCEKIYQTTVTQPSTITVSNSIIDENCGTSDGQASITVTGGSNTNYTYLWQNGATTNTSTGLGNGKHYITVTDGAGCNYLDSVQVASSGSLTVTTNTVDVLCNGESSGSISLNILSGITPYTYYWSNLESTSTLSGLSVATYTVTVTDGSGCQGSTSTSISEPTSLSVSNSISNPNCSAAFTGSVSVTATGGTTPYAYLWNNSQTDIQATGLSAGQYTVTISDNNNCETLDSVTLTDPSAITVSVNSTSDADCYGASTGSASVSASGGASNYTYAWSNGNTTNNVNNLNAGTHIVSVSDQNGCNETASVTIAEPTEVYVGNVTTTNASCEGLSDGSINITVSGGNTPYIYDWSNNSTNNTLTAVPSGTYGVTVTDSNGCIIDSTGIVVNVFEANAEFTWNADSYLAPAEVDFTNMSTGADYFTWDFGTGLTSDAENPTYTFTEAGEYQVILTAYVDSNKLCNDTAMHIIVIEEEPSYHIPIVFSPNGDGENDIFTINGINIDEIEGVIFNRWGTEIFKWNTIQGGWDGRTYAGAQAPEGTYFYVITVRIVDTDQPEPPFNGTVTLVR